jgi:hypothetical protein
MTVLRRIERGVVVTGGMESVVRLWKVGRGVEMVAAVKLGNPYPTVWRYRPDTREIYDHPIKDTIFHLKKMYSNITKCNQY